MTTRHTKNVTTKTTENRLAKCQTTEHYSDGDGTYSLHTENNANLVGFTGTVHFYSGRGHIPAGTDQLDEVV